MIHTLPTPQEMRHRFTLSAQAGASIAQYRKDIARILTGEDTRLLAIVGPCSIHDKHSALEFAQKLKTLQESLSDTFLLVMRVYFEKPRTRYGWKGLLNDPLLNDSYDLTQGLALSCQILHHIAELQLPIATEVVSPFILPYWQDYLSWMAIGARTSESPPHREMSSLTPFAVGVKNNRNGEIEEAIHAILAIRHAQTFLSINDEGRVASTTSKGNPFAHLILRGAKNQPNYQKESVNNACKQLSEEAIDTRIIIDCSHDNSQKDPKQQISVLQDIIQQIQEGNQKIAGFMMESHLHFGTQPLDCPSNLQYGVSITDPCLDFASTAQALRQAAQYLKR